MVPVVTLSGTRRETAGTPLVCLIVRITIQDTLKTRYFLVYLERLHMKRFFASFEPWCAWAPNDFRFTDCPVIHATSSFNDRSGHPRNLIIQ